ncbi:MAG: hypothetical protein WCF90_10030 [Methanomicrobiales archaeon]
MFHDDNIIAKNAVAFGFLAHHGRHRYNLNLLYTKTVFYIVQYFYIVPILLLAYPYPRYTVYFTIILGWIFLGLVYMYGPVGTWLYVPSSAFFCMCVSVGVIMSAFFRQLMQEKKYREIVRNPWRWSLRSISSPRRFSRSTSCRLIS